MKLVLKDLYSFELYKQIKRLPYFFLVTVTEMGANSETEVITCIFGLLLLMERMQAIWDSTSEILAHTVIGITRTSVYHFVVARIILKFNTYAKQ